MNLKNNDKLNFVIGTFLNIQEDTTGGNIVLHKLAFEIANRGHNVYIFTEPHYKQKNIEIIPSNYVVSNDKTFFTWEPITFPIDKTIVIYPQTTIGNPLNINNVCRWILYHTQYDIETSYGDKDIYFNFGEFKTFNNKEKGKLTIFDYNFDKLYVTNNQRQGFCHLLHKNTPENSSDILKFFNSKDLGEFKTIMKYDIDYLRNELNKYEYFLTYDKKSFFTVAAILCGCKAIILDAHNKVEFFENAFVKSSEYSNTLTPTEYRLKNPIQMFGVAYGIEDISWANKTIDFATGHLKELEKIDNKTVDNFIKFWEKKIFEI